MHSMFGKLRWSASFHSAGFASHLSNYSLQLYKHIVSLSLSPETTGLSTTGTWTIMCCRCMDIEHNAVCVIREFWCGKTACVKLYVFFCLFVFYIFTTFSSSSFFCIVHCLFSAVCQVPWLYAASLQTSAILRFSARFLRNDLNIVWKLCMFRGLCSKSFFFFFLTFGSKWRGAYRCQSRHSSKHAVHFCCSSFLTFPLKLLSVFTFLNHTNCL